MNDPDVWCLKKNTHLWTVPPEVSVFNPALGANETNASKILNTMLGAAPIPPAPPALGGTGLSRGSAAGAHRAARAGLADGGAAAGGPESTCVYHGSQHTDLFSVWAIHRDALRND